MARTTGAVRFPDGVLLSFVYNGVVDQARPRLFSTRQAAEDAWDDRQVDVAYFDADPLTDEPVEVMPYYYTYDNHEGMFFSMANREKMLITGSPSLDRAYEVEDSGVDVRGIFEFYKNRSRANAVPASVPEPVFAGAVEVMVSGLYQNIAGGGAVVGAWLGEPLLDSSLRPVVIVGPCRSGKGVTAVLPTLLTWKGSVVTFDVLGEQERVTADYRRSIRGRVLSLDFADEKSEDRFNVLDTVRRGTEFELADIKTLAKSFAMNCNVKTEDGPTAAEIVQLLISAAFEGQAQKTSMHGVMELCFSSIHEVIAKLATASPDSEAQQDACRVAAAFSQLDTEEQLALIQVVQRTLSMFAYPAVAANSDVSTFSLDELLNAEQPFTLYVRTRPDSLELLSPLLNAFFSQLGNRLLQTTAGDARQATLLLLDDFLRIGKLDFISNSWSEFQDHGVKLYVTTQRMRHWNDVYGEGAPAWTAPTIQILFGSNTYEDAILMADTVCKAAPVDTPAPIISKVDVMRMAQFEAIVLGATERPMRAVMTKYADSPEYRERASY